ncbi:peptidase inhibitor family I36 protein [Saccharothrix isguenensis]
MIRRILTMIGGVVAAVALLSAPAQAADEADVRTYTAQSDSVSTMAWSDCPSARQCIFANLNGGRPYGYFASGDGDLADSSGPQGLNNTTESVWNRTGQYWCFYDAGGYNNLIFIVAPGVQTNLVAEDRNRVTSLRVCP